MAEDKSRFHNVHGYLKMALDLVCNSKVSICNESLDYGSIEGFDARSLWATWLTGGTNPTFIIMELC